MNFVQSVEPNQRNIASILLETNHQRIFAMTNLFNKPPLGIKKSKDKKDEKFLQKIRELPCCICKRFGMVQRSPTTAHHPIHDRYGTRKVSDRLAIPLCDDHHQQLWGTDKSKLAIHKEPLKWRELYGPDYSYSFSSVQETDT